MNDPNDPNATVPRTSPEATAARTDDTDPAHAPGRTSSTAPGVPGFELYGELGRGTMGVVYRAKQVGLNRAVALKMMIAGPYAAPAARARFLVEAEAVAALEHPNVIKVFAFGEHDGLPYLAMEYLPAGSLADRIRAQEAFAPAEAARTVAQLARAVSHAHAKGVIHRDIKPANVLLAADGSVRLTDFGLAKVDAGSDLTGTGAVLGTPAYMSPEQAAGNLREVGPAADIYALGAVLYELLAGRPPFQADSITGTLRLVLTAEPVGPRAANPAVPRDLETVCLKCLSKAPARRYPSASELADDLDRAARGEPVQARRVGPLERAARRAIRHRRALAGSSLVLALAVALGIVAARQSPESLPPVQPPTPSADDPLSVIEELDRADPGWRIEQIDKARRAVPDAENSALTIRAVRAALPAAFNQQAKQFEATEAALAPTAPLPPAARLGPEYHKARGTAQRLAAQPFGRFPLNWDRSAFTTSLPETQSPREATLLLRWAAVSAASTGDGDAALLACLGCVNAGRALHDEPTAVSQLVRVACGTVGASAAVRALALGTAPNERLAALGVALRDEARAPLLRTVARAERGMVHRVFGVVSAGDTIEPEPDAHPDEVELFKRLPRGAAARPSHAWVLRHYTELVRIADRPLHEQTAAITAWGDTIRRDAPAGARLVLIAADKVGTAFRRYAALTRAIEAALAAERFRLARGRWPESLAELVPAFLPEVPADPEDGAPLRFRRLPDGLVVYGVGTDRIDGGGNVTPTAPNESPSDFGARLYDPAARGAAR